MSLNYFTIYSFFASNWKIRSFRVLLPSHDVDCKEWIQQFLFSSFIAFFPTIFTSVDTVFKFVPIHLDSLSGVRCWTRGNYGVCRSGRVGLGVARPAGSYGASGETPTGRRCCRRRVSYGPSPEVYPPQPLSVCQAGPPTSRRSIYRSFPCCRMLTTGLFIWT